jgi:hypothetical protein
MLKMPWAVFFTQRFSTMGDVTPMTQNNKATSQNLLFFAISPLT